MSCNTDVTTQTVLRFSAASTLDIPAGTTIRVRAWRNGERQHEAGTDLGSATFGEDTQIVINAANNDGDRRFTVFAELLSPTGARLSWARVRAGHVQDMLSEVRVQFAAGCRAPSDQLEERTGALPFEMCGSHETCNGDEGECASPCYAAEPFAEELASAPSLPEACPHSDGLRVDSIVVGWNFSCGITAGEAFCWGSHSYGNDTASTTRVRPSRVFTQQGRTLPDDDPIVSMDLEIHTHCALHESGRLACGGLTNFAHIGVPFPAGQRYVPCCALSPALPPIKEFGIGEARALALTRDGAMYRLGYGDIDPFMESTLAEEITVGGYTTFIYGPGGTILDGAQAEFVEGSFPPSAASFVDIESRHRTVCGVSEEGELLCWGEPPTDIGEYSEQPTSLGEGWSRIGWGLFNLQWADEGIEDEVAHVCGVRNGTLLCWGRNVRERLGAPSTIVDAPQTVPIQVGTDSDWADVEPGYNHTCAMKTDGRVFCFGDGSRGQLGVESGGTFVPQEVLIPRW